jgi:hypothetical protein
LFDDPVRDERALYAKYWQEKLKNNAEIDFPDKLVEEVADLTNEFSFAYLKEILYATVHLSLSVLLIHLHASISSLVILASYEGDDKPTFATTLKQQIRVLQKQLDKMPKTKAEDAKRDFRPLFDTLAKARSSGPQYVGPPSGERDFRVLLDRLVSEREREGRPMDLQAMLAESQRMLQVQMSMVRPSASAAVQLRGTAVPKLD